MALDFSKTASTKTAKQRMQQAAATNTAGKIVNIPVSKLKESPLNKNMPLLGLDDLAKSIEENGLQEALLVYDLKDGTYEIYAGHRRFRAIRDILKEKTAKCIVKPYPESEKVRFKDHFINNAERRENNYRFWMAEVAAAREALLAAGYDGTKRELVEEMSKLLDGKVSVAQIYRYEAVEKMHPSVIDLGDLGYSVYVLYGASSLTKEQQERFAEKMKDATEKNGNEPISQKSVAAMIEAVKAKAPAKIHEPEAEPERQLSKYETKLAKTEIGIAKVFAKPKTEEDKKAARESIARIRAALDEFEKNLG